MLLLLNDAGDPRFALVYRFVGDVFGSGGPVEAQLQRLRGVDPAVVDTVSARCLPRLESLLHVAILHRLGSHERSLLF